MWMDFIWRICWYQTDISISWILISLGGSFKIHPNSLFRCYMSSLTNHTIPPFYACYLLRSKKNNTFSHRFYIGSTPDPPRRIRQHNGELTNGAWKTRLYKPWEMEVIVYGFPSKLTALQVLDMFVVYYRDMLCCLIRTCFVCFIIYLTVWMGMAEPLQDSLLEWARGTDIL